MQAYEYQITPKDLTDYLFYGYWEAPANQKRRWLMRYLLPLVAFASGGYLLFWGTSTAGNIYGGFVLLSGVFILLFPRIYYYRIEKQSEQIAAHEQGKQLFAPSRLVVAKDTLSFESQGGTPLEVPLEAVRRVQTSPSHLAIYYGQTENEQFRLIPKASFASEEEWKQLVANLKAEN